MDGIQGNPNYRNFGTLPPLTIIVEQIDAIKKHENQLFYATTVDYLFKN